MIEWLRNSLQMWTHFLVPSELIKTTILKSSCPVNTCIPLEYKRNKKEKCKKKRFTTYYASTSESSLDRCIGIFKNDHRSFLYTHVTNNSFLKAWINIAGVCNILVLYIWSKTRKKNSNEYQGILKQKLKAPRNSIRQTNKQSNTVFNNT